MAEDARIHPGPRSGRLHPAPGGAGSQGRGFRGLAEPGDAHGWGCTRRWLRVARGRQRGAGRGELWGMLQSWGLVAFLPLLPPPCCDFLQSSVWVCAHGLCSSARLKRRGGGEADCVSGDKGGDGTVGHSFISQQKETEDLGTKNHQRRFYVTGLQRSKTCPHPHPCPCPCPCPAAESSLRVLAAGAVFALWAAAGGCRLRAPYEAVRCHPSPGSAVPRGRRVPALAGVGRVKRMEHGSGCPDPPDAEPGRLAPARRPALVQHLRMMLLLEIS